MICKGFQKGLIYKGWDETLLDVGESFEDVGSCSALGGRYHVRNVGLQMKLSW